MFRLRFFLPAVVVLALFLGFFSAESAIAREDNPGSSPDFIYLTYASSDPAHTINVSWKSDENYVGKVYYDTESRGGTPESYSYSKNGSGGVSNSELEGYYHHVELTGLEPDTKYYFIAGNSGSGWSGEQSFKTAPVEPDNLTFVVGGDSRSNKFFHATNPYWPEARNEVTKVAASYNPDFICFGGDYLSSGQEQRGADTWENWLGAWYEYARTDDGSLIPLVPVVGNHEITYPQPEDYNPSEDASNYYTVFNLPGNERWYSLDWGSRVHFTVLDSEILDTDTTAWSDQSDWLGSDLDANENDLWKIASFHRPLYSTPGEHGGELDHLEDWTWFFDKYHVDLAFQSHNHGYERTGPINHTFNPGELLHSPENGTIYVTAAGWGAELYGNSKDYNWFTAPDSPGRIGEPENAFHCVVNEISDGTYQYTTVKYNGEILDNFTIQKEFTSAEEGEEGLPWTAIGVVVVAIVLVVAVVSIAVRRR